ncbi:hypothetical protein TNCV_2448651 [Trichonephila clavipes]|uniref:Uncharacterized protein n=1 Tax=Trichonephila clavipes TaxID=2585209 RepID=A0A8X6SFF9_TRICX|nr:hypothetical protein TNCV_2448651 [Trichonephila clavipes]
MKSVADALGGHRFTCSWKQPAMDVLCRGEIVSNSELVNTLVCALEPIPVGSTSSSAWGGGMPKGTQFTRKGFRATNRYLGKQSLPCPYFIEKKTKFTFYNY